MIKSKTHFAILFLALILFPTGAACAVAGVIHLPQTGQQTCWNSSGTVIPCTGTGQDGETRAGVLWPNPRFTDNNDQTITDNLTGLRWTKNGKTPGPYGCLPGLKNSWQGALDYVKCLNTENYLGYNDWRLPNVTELQSMVNAGEPGSTAWLNSQGFTNVQYSYWSSSTSAYYTNDACAVSMDSGSVFPALKDDEYLLLGRNDGASLHTWPVRAGSGASNPSAVSLPQTGQTSCYRFLDPYHGNPVIPCAGTGQDGDLQTGVAWPVPRFTDNGDQTVTDRLTGIAWSKSGDAPGPEVCGPGEAKTWQGALDHVKCLNTNNYLDYNDWRLPNVNELKSLVNLSQQYQAGWLYSQGFVDVRESNYWTSGTVTPPGWAGYAQVVDLFGGSFVSVNGKTNTARVWPMRTGQSGPLGSLTISKSGSGSVTVNTGTIAWDGDRGSAIFAGGTSVELTAAPDAGWQFIGWSGACTGLGTCSVTMDTSKAVAAFFAPETACAMTSTVGAGGTVTPSTYLSYVDYGSSVTFTMVPKEGHHIADVLVDGASVGPATTHTFTCDVTASHRIDTSFAIDTYAITSTAGENGAISPSVTANYGSNATFLLTPDAGYHVAGVLVDGFSVTPTPAETFTFSNVQADHTISVAFAVNTHSTVRLPQTGQHKCWNASGAQVSCTGSGQDGELRKGDTWPSPRFADNGDQTMTDHLTGLIWTKDGNAPGPAACGSGATMAWQGALDYVKCLNTNHFLGHDDWRLPNVNELESLINAEEANPAAWLNAQGFANVQADRYQSSSTVVDGFDWAWTVSMDDGAVGAYNSQTDSLHAWPLRSAEPGNSVVSLPRSGQTKCDYGLTLLPPSPPVVCTGTGRDGDLQTGTAWPEPRFTNNGDQTMTDNLTGIVWTKNGNGPGPSVCSPGTTKTWQGALDYVKCLNANHYLGYDDWRLPNRGELRSIVNYDYGMAIWLGSQGFIDVQSYYSCDPPAGCGTAAYWSSSSGAFSANSAWALTAGFGASGSLNRYPKSANYSVWPVRAGQPGRLTVLKSGAGSVTVNKGVLTWNGHRGSAIYDQETSITLAPAPDPGNSFWGWSGDCTGKSACILAMDGNKNVTAIFGKIGDANNDGAVDLTDAIVALKLTAAISLSGQEIFTGADADGDGRIGIAEAIYILQKTAELR